MDKNDLSSWEEQEAELRRRNEVLDAQKIDNSSIADELLRKYSSKTPILDNPALWNPDSPRGYDEPSHANVKSAMTMVDAEYDSVIASKASEKPSTTRQQSSSKQRTHNDTSIQPRLRNTGSVSASAVRSSRPSSAVVRPPSLSRPSSTVPKSASSSHPQSGPSTIDTDNTMTSTEDTDDALPLDGMSSQSVIRFQKAKILSLEGTVTTLTQQLQSQQQEKNKGNDKYRSLVDDHAKLQKRLAACEAALGKHKQVAVDCRKRCDELERDAMGHKKEIDRLMSLRSKMETEAKSQDSKLSRALIELEKAKGKTHVEPVIKENRQDITKLENDNRRLLQQKNDLLLAMKKQYKLVTILKKQLAHLEAARMIQFAESDFVKAMQTDGHI